MISGDIKINDVALGGWSAENVGTHEGFATYDCTLWYTDNKGYANKARWRLFGHNRADGAVSLAARILLEGMTRVYGTTKETI